MIGASTIASEMPGLVTGHIGLGTLIALQPTNSVLEIVRIASFASGFSTGHAAMRAWLASNDCLERKME
jgi:hypothetical protein